MIKLIYILRMAYAFSRDGAMPLSSLWHKVNKQEVPINAVWLSAFIAFCMALTVCSSLFSAFYHGPEEPSEFESTRDVNRNMYYQLQILSVEIYPLINLLSAGNKQNTDDGARV